jgi:hydrogenase maturation protein HypF
LTQASYEAEAPMRLEALARGPAVDALRAEPMPLVADEEGVLRADWSLLVRQLLLEQASPAEHAARVHSTFIETAVAVALRMRAAAGALRVGLAGGVFQNRLLAEGITRRLSAAGIPVSLSERIPCNDAGIAYGQIVDTAGREN